MWEWLHWCRWSVWLMTSPAFRSVSVINQLPKILGNFMSTDCLEFYLENPFLPFSLIDIDTAYAGYWLYALLWKSVRLYHIIGLAPFGLRKGSSCANQKGSTKYKAYLLLLLSQRKLPFFLGISSFMLLVDIYELLPIYFDNRHVWSASESWSRSWTLDSSQVPIKLVQGSGKSRSDSHAFLLLIP